MQGLVNLLYGESGMLFQIESGCEKNVFDQDKELLVQYAELVNQRYKDNTVAKEDLMIFIDVLDTFSAFQHVDWIRELSARIHSTLTRGIHFIK